LTISKIGCTFANVNEIPDLGWESAVNMISLRPMTSFSTNLQKGSRGMGIEEVKTAIRALAPEERRKVALFILELEKNHLTDTIGPQITEDLEGLKKVLQESVEKLKKFVKTS
jgi:hypothetical protein